MKYSIFIFSILFFAALSFSQGRSKEAVFHRFDRDGNGIVTAVELPDAKTRAKFDKDGDGDVTLAEYRKTMGISDPSEAKKPIPNHTGALARLDFYIKETDKNGDGKLSREEAGEEPWFGRIDRNKDGMIGPGEIAMVRALVKKFGDKGLTIPENQVTKEDVAKITSGPEILKPGDVGIGRMIPDIEFTDLNGKVRRLSEVKNHKGLVIAMTSATCPVSKRLLPSLAKLELALADEDIPMILVNAFGSETEKQIREQLATQEFSASYIHDVDKDLSRALGAATTTEVFLIDPKQTLLYRGALNDQYGIDYSIDEPRHRYLEDAVAAFLKNESPAIAATAAPGCELNLGGKETDNIVGANITYHRDVARILLQNCVQCHHDGGIAPFALDEFDEVSDRAKVIKRVVSEGTMPPWFAVAPEDETESPWANDHSLSTRDRTDLLAWLDSDQPKGNPGDAPEPRVFSEEWSNGTPDLVIPLSKAYKIKATGFMPYQRDLVVTELSEDKWVTGYEILPSARDVVHHVIVQVFDKDAKVRNRGESEGYWAAYVPGNGAVQYPDGFARKFPAGAKVHFQIHYTPSGEEKMERLKMGLHFADEPPQFQVKTLAIVDHKLNIPPGAAAHKEGTSRTMPFDIPAMSFMAHMHTRGSAFSYEITYPDGKKEMLLDIPRYDFNWQLRYELKTPKILPRGSTVKVTGVFDNSVNNRANPDPTKTVKWGNQTVEEMLIGYIEYFVPIAKRDLAKVE